jgi:integrase
MRITQDHGDNFMRLTDAKIRNTKQSERPLKLTDGHGLYLAVRPTGSKLWRYRFRIHGKETTISLGEYPLVGLQEARECHREARKQVQQGVNPAQQRRAQKLIHAAEQGCTFESVALEYFHKKQDKWVPSYAAQFERHLRRSVFPKIGAFPIRDVTPGHILEILRSLETNAPTVAKMIRQWCSAVFRYAIARMLATNDPTSSLKGALVTPKPVHYRSLSRADLPAFMNALDSYQHDRVTQIYLRLLLLCFTRPTELRAAEWVEFNLTAAEWRIPAVRIKSKQTHLVPLSRQAVMLLRELQTITGARLHLFPNSREPRTFMGDSIPRKALRRMGYQQACTLHGFRSTASTILNEAGWRSDVIEAQLAHRESNRTRASYNHAVYLTERRQMMQAWADLLDSLLGNNVIPMYEKQVG